jgi:hypothetical protein
MGFRVMTKKYLFLNKKEDKKMRRVMLLLLLGFNSDLG